MNYILEGVSDYSKSVYHTFENIPITVALIVTMGGCDMAVLYLCQWLRIRYPNRIILINRLQILARYFFSWYSHRYVNDIVDPFDIKIHTPFLHIVSTLLLPESEIYTNSIIQLIIGLALIQSNIIQVSLIELILNVNRPTLRYIFSTYIAPDSGLESLIDSLVIFLIEFMLDRPIALIRLVFTVSVTLLIQYINPMRSEDILATLERVRDDLQDKIRRL